MWKRVHFIMHFLFCFPSMFFKPSKHSNATIKAYKKILRWLLRWLCYIVEYWQTKNNCYNKCLLWSWISYVVELNLNLIATVSKPWIVEGAWAFRWISVRHTSLIIQEVTNFPFKPWISLVKKECNLNTSRVLS